MTRQEFRQAYIDEKKNSYDMDFVNYLIGKRILFVPYNVTFRIESVEAVNIDMFEPMAVSYKLVGGGSQVIQYIQVIGLYNNGLGINHMNGHELKIID